MAIHSNALIQEREKDKQGVSKKSEISVFFGLISRVVDQFGHMIPFWNRLDNSYRLKHVQDFECLDGDFFNKTHTMTPFWNPWDLSHTPDMIPESLGTILRIRKVKNVQKLGFWWILGVLMGIFSMKPTL